MTQAVESAFLAVPRWQFLPLDIMEDAALDVPLPIGFGQSNSQPSTVGMMLDWLQVDRGDKILDLGSGSGWTAALLSYLTGAEGRVIAVEIIPELLEFGEENCKKFGVRNANFYAAGPRYGWWPEAPYDRILVGAGAQEIPRDLLDQLAVGGRMVIPVADNILVIEKDAIDHITTESHAGFAFVPLV